MSPDTAALGLPIVGEQSTGDVTRFVDREAPGLLAYFVRRTSSPDDAADLLGDALVVIWRRRSAIPSDATQARMWMYGVARKVLAGYLRGTRRRNALSERLRGELAMHPITPATAGSDTAQARELIDALRETDREIVRLVYWEGFSLVEIAGILSMRPGTVRSRHARALSRMREALGGDK